MDTALYFPYISVPQGSWFTRVLLYWDGVASVVPRHLSDRAAALTPFMGGTSQGEACPASVT